MPLLWKSLVVVILAPLGCAFLLKDRSLAGQIVELEISNKHQSGGPNQENPQKVGKKSFLNKKPRFILGFFSLDENLMDAFTVARFSTGYTQCVSIYWPRMSENFYDF